MRILVVGAGATGGYFGGRLLAGGHDVTFLVRGARASQLAESGLVIRSPKGDVTLEAPPLTQAGEITSPFDVILVSCKAFDLDSAIASFAPAVGPDSAILPLLNGMRHLDLLDAKFGPEHVLGGLCSIVATMNDRHEVVHLQPMQSMRYGERDGSLSKRVRAIDAIFGSAIAGAGASETILADMWAKWVFLGSLAATTCLMRASIGNILAVPGGRAFILATLDEAAGVATACGFSPGGPWFEETRAMLTAQGAPTTASMFRDIEAGHKVEADHILGDLLTRAKAHGVPVPNLHLAYIHLKAYEERRG
ncbi:MAG: 2-dehydropantoate 2-reductase [Alphaproteobacteria bacterium]|nr:2-dehydropantoate 2-reductase [Alphaproteobacteria bacterium]